jgi:hypothetical protein
VVGNTRALLDHDDALQDGCSAAEIGKVRSLAPSRARRITAVALVGMVLGAVAVFGFLASRKDEPDLVPFASIYHQPLSQLDVALTGGDGHAFAVIAEDPTLSRPSVLREPAEFAYRAQRPAWGYLTWMASAGQARFTGWVLVGLTILSCGAACAVASLLLLDRGRSPWWGLLVPVAGFETLTEMTPELFALALIGAGVLLWQRDRRVAAVVVFSVAVLTRETVMVAIVALACWDLFHRAGPATARLRRVLPLGIPAAVYVAWICFLRLRLGTWPFFRSNERLSLPGFGLAKALGTTQYASAILFWVVIGLALAGTAIRWARHDVLTWITVGYAAFATMLGSDVWVTNMGFQRALLTLYVFGAIAVLGGVGGRSADAEQRREEPTGVALRRLGHQLGRPFDDDAPTAVAALGTEIDDPVGRLHDVEVVLDHEHRVTGVHQPL